MKIIDARTGNEVREGDLMVFPEGDDGYFLRKVERKGFLKADAHVTSFYKDQEGKKVKETGVVPLIIRILHPSYFLQRVAFFPS